MDFLKSCFVSVLIDYRFGIASLINKKELLQVNDPVQFNADVNEEFAVNIHATREKLRAMVEAMKGNLNLHNKCNINVGLWCRPAPTHFRVS